MQRIGVFSAIAFAGAVALTAQARGEEHLLVNVFPGPQHLALMSQKTKVWLPSEDFLWTLSLRRPQRHGGMCWRIAETIAGRRTCIRAAKLRLPATQLQ